MTGLLSKPSHNLSSFSRYLRSDKVDFEGELGLVIGRPCKNVEPEEALSYVLGYVCANDVSARDWQKDPFPAAPRQEIH